jgi:ribokinase
MAGSRPIDVGKMIHVIGNAAVDTVIRVDRFPRPGETIVALGASQDLGGKGLNQAVVAARCGAPVRLVAAVGADDLGERIRSSLAQEGVLTDGLATSSYGTDRCVITVDRQGENTILSLVDAARNFDPVAETPIDRWISPGDWTVLQGNLRSDVTRNCLALAKSKGATTALNPSPTHLADEYDWTLVDLAVLNRSEALELAGDIDVEHAAHKLLDEGASAVVVTLGGEGCVFFSASDAFCVAAPKIQAVDTVGAGDVFCGTLMAARVLGLGWRETLGAATEAASASTARAGVLASFPSGMDMARLLKRAAMMSLEEHRR